MMVTNMKVFCALNVYGYEKPAKTKKIYCIFIYVLIAGQIFLFILFGQFGIFLLNRRKFVSLVRARLFQA